MPPLALPSSPRRSPSRSPRSSPHNRPRSPRRKTLRKREASSRRIKSVQFDRIELVEFLPDLGDNPSVSAGVPLRLGMALRTHRLRLEKYERRRKPRRCMWELILERNVREDL